MNVNTQEFPPFLYQMNVSKTYHQLHQRGLQHFPTKEINSQMDQNENLRADHNVNGWSKTNISEKYMQQRNSEWGGYIPYRQVFEPINIPSKESADSPELRSMMKHDPFNAVQFGQQSHMPLFGGSCLNRPGESDSLQMENMSCGL